MQKGGWIIGENDEGQSVYQGINICSNSQASSKALLSYKITSRPVMQYPKKLEQLAEGNSVTLLWVPGHSDIDGNENTDELARRENETKFIASEPVVGVSQKRARVVVETNTLLQHNLLCNKLQTCRLALIVGCNRKTTEFVLSGTGRSTDLLTACYIDIDRNEVDTDHEYSDWNYLPDIILEEVFAYLNVKDRYYASLVCRHWYEAFYLPQVWSTFVIDDQTLTRAKFNYYSGWQYVLDHFRTQNCLARIGDYIRGLDFRPVHSFNNLYQFMTLIAWYMEQNRDPKGKEVIQVGGRITNLTFLFPCDMAAADNPDGVKLFGTGGQLLAALKRLLTNLTELKTLKLIDLMLQRYDANHLLDEVLHSCCLGLKVLHLINVTSVHCPIMHAGLFLNLKVLVISPQSIDDDVLQLLGDSNVRHLHLLQNRYTPQNICIAPCTAKGWRSVRRDNPALCVHLRVESTGGAHVLLQPDAPVHSIMYHTPKTQISSATLLKIVDMYNDTLSSFGHELLPRFSSPKPFESRADSLLLLMARQCPNLTNLVIREKISTATILLLASAAKNLRLFYVRRNAVILRCDWPRNPEWSDSFYSWLKSTALSYTSTEREVSKILGLQSWTMLPDRAFKTISVNVRLTCTKFL